MNSSRPAEPAVHAPDTVWRAAERRRAQALLALMTARRAAGRLSGSPGAQLVASVLGRHWAALGLEAWDASGYLRPVDVPATRLSGAAELTLGARSFAHRGDFAEDVAHAAPGRAQGPLRILVPGQGLPSDRLAGSVLLVPEAVTGLDVARTAAQAASHGAQGLLLAAPAGRWFAKSVQVGRGQIPVARVREQLAAELTRSGELPVRLDLPLARDPRRCHNVVGTLPGRDRSRALLVSAHFDHLGDDPSGLRFPGAFDNASGVALMVALAWRIAARPRASRPVDVVFAALTGEESGLHGARALLEDQPRPWAAAINLDALALRQPGFAMRLGHARAGDPLAERAADWLARRGVELDAADGRDDSAVWRSAGMPTLGLGQQRRGGPWPMHTPADDLAALDLSRLWALMDLIDDLLNQVPAWLPAPQPQGALP